MEEKPRVVEGIVLDRDGTPLTAPAEPTRGPSSFGARFKLIKASPLLIVGAVVAIPVILAFVLVLALFLILMTLITGKRPRIIRFSR